ncbi:hypothetical protein DYB30_008404 [Aphanomyces astaci]|uniref:PPM-type phosphatase domain-containing protein n=1 Tax=Aphanomyces astaci TaxID=112090 RepID=A0A397CUT7_APHAT|nr:hypothetical protein DYB30_008404 [Aphanomyces astaci]
MRDRIEARNTASRKRASQARQYTSAPSTPSSTPSLTTSHSISKWNRSPADATDVLDADTLAKYLNHPCLPFVAVFDGHGGTRCADFLQHGLLPQLKHHLLHRSFHDAPHESMSTAMQSACRDADKAFLDSHLADDSGSCAVFALIGKDKWVVVLSRHGRAVDLCVAHSPQHPDERARILAANGHIVQDRFIFGYLGVSRSFGDRFVKVERPVVITTPDVVSGGSRHLHPGDEFLLLACDGLFEVFTPQEAVDFVAHHRSVNQMTPQAICDLLVHTAIENGSQDNTLLVLGAVAALMLADVGERFTFKLMVDRMESYRYFLAQITTFLYIPPMFCIVGYKATQTDFIDEEVNEFPKYKFFIMAVLDLCHAMLLFIPGGNTPPALTVIFMQATIPFSMLFGYLFHDYQYSRMQVVGCILMSSGLLLGILPLVLLSCSLASDVFEEAEMGWNSLCFLLAAVPGALSMLYKEQALAPQPMDVYYLNAWVAVYQFIGGLLLAPVIFDIPTLHLDQRISGLECLVNGVSEVRTDKCHEPHTDAITLSAAEKEAVSLLDESSDSGLRYMA